MGMREKLSQNKIKIVKHKKENDRHEKWNEGKEGKANLEAVDVGAEHDGEEAEVGVVLCEYATIKRWIW